MMKRITLLFFLASALLACSSCNRSSHSRTFDLRDSLAVEYMAYAGLFYDSAFLDWDMIVNLGLNQNKADWGAEIDKIMHPILEGAWSCLVVLGQTAEREDLPSLSVSSA